MDPSYNSKKRKADSEYSDNKNTSKARKRYQKKSGDELKEFQEKRNDTKAKTDGFAKIKGLAANLLDSLSENERAAEEKLLRIHSDNFVVYSR